MTTGDSGRTDVLTPEQRRLNMSRIRGSNTKPELQVRRMLHGAGFRYQLHKHDLPGRPDLVMPKYRAVVFVHGCFWHHHNCPLFRWPRNRAEFWRTKIESNVRRDNRVERTLQEDGWRVLIVWECALRGKGRLSADDFVTAVRSWLAGQATWGEVRTTLPAETHS